ncbi:hypothetical protein QP248_02785 [Aerococcus sp. UMB8608]|uniref:Uncharacterized protein n=1 Tax=Aerococcus sanguinicola TaxID=119206 RepID=A0A0X8FB32_9LACT|nr:MULTISPECIES: hypothetical protein [Aerococcus]AMB93277.1 hypothetical protein AWM72_00075 [Aerococcus sanguinicola]MDK6679376.1 hypothetical protein [Aerococcus sp. UMB8608]MDK6685782.1 hypothetical protein [Aerococcus sp. UMB8623]OFT95909.1 hypothetical protein HMPREF3090_03555 [Aerococcus sp. HMSC23C02]
MNDIYQVKTIRNTSMVNSFLENGWILLHIGDISSEKEPLTLTKDIVFVVGATKEIYDRYPDIPSDLSW